MKKTITYSAEDEEGDYEETVELPAIWEVCGRCHGEGKHDPESFAGGFSSEDFAEDPDFAEEYFKGSYDVPCEECHGRTTVLMVDEARLNDEQKKHYEAYQKEQYEIGRDRAAERKLRNLENGYG